MGITKLDLEGGEAKHNRKERDAGRHGAAASEVEHTPGRRRIRPRAPISRAQLGAWSIFRGKTCGRSLPASSVVER
jgi:hypothetical protein